MVKIPVVLSDANLPLHATDEGPSRLQADVPPPVQEGSASVGVDKPPSSVDHDGDVNMDDTAPDSVPQDERGHSPPIDTNATLAPLVPLDISVDVGAPPLADACSPHNNQVVSPMASEPLCRGDECQTTPIIDNALPIPQHPVLVHQVDGAPTDQEVEIDMELLKQCLGGDIEETVSSSDDDPRQRIAVDPPERQDSPMTEMDTDAEGEEDPDVITNILGMTGLATKPLPSGVEKSDSSSISSSDESSDDESDTPAQNRSTLNVAPAEIRQADNQLRQKSETTSSRFRRSSRSVKTSPAVIEKRTIGKRKRTKKSSAIVESEPEDNQSAESTSSAVRSWFEMEKDAFVCFVSLPFQPLLYV